MMQPAKNDNDAMSALTGGAGDLFSRRKARGFEAVMQIVTTICGALCLHLLAYFRRLRLRYAIPGHSSAFTFPPFQT